MARSSRERRPRTRGAARLRLPGPRGLLPILCLLTFGAAVLAPATATVPSAAHGPGATTGSAPVPVSGVVVDQYSGHPIANATVRALDFTLRTQVTVTDALGRFTVRSVPGTLYLTVDPPTGYAGTSLHLPVGDRGIYGLVLGLVPAALLAHLAGSGDAAVLPGLAALAAACVGGAVVALRARRVREGRSPRMLSRFGRFVVRRGILIPAQLVALLVVLYVFGSYLPALAIAGRTGCLSVAAAGCATCPAGTAFCQVSVFGSGLGQFLVALLTGQWGVASIGSFRAPAVDFLSWWLPNSLELAAVALTLSVAIGYPLGIAAGWRPNGPLDRSVRSVSIVLLLVPTFLVVLFVLLLSYDPWLQYVGDNPYGLLPSPGWFLAQGTFPTWLGVDEQTSPTGFPLIDGMLHGAWPFVGVIATKLLLQAFAITLIYVPIFLRFARHAVAEAARSEAVRAARSRGVPEPTLEWRHTGRRTLPIYLLVFGSTLPAYIGTQALVEVLFNDTQGFGTILFSEMTQIGRTGFAVLHHGSIPTGNLYQITILGLALVLLIGNLCADVLARYLDPTLDEEGRR